MFSVINKNENVTMHSIRQKTTKCCQQESLTRSMDILAECKRDHIHWSNIWNELHIGSHIYTHLNILLHWLGADKIRVFATI